MEIEGKKLSESQKKAINTTGDNICVNAGAGSGKTLTIIAKVIHLLDQEFAKPEEIVVVAYNNHVANELRKEYLINLKNIQILKKNLEEFLSLKEVNAQSAIKR
tara:strand:- start:405 stop:716 length:312 start_codon:yes stop_codon:yes gene_type:complete